MVSRFFILFCFIAIIIAVLLIQSYAGGYEVFHTPKNLMSAWSRCGSLSAENRSKEIPSECAYYFLTNDLPYDEYMLLIDKEGKEINKQDHLNEGVVTSIASNKDGSHLYIGKVKVYVHDESCFFLIKNSRKKLCRPDLKKDFYKIYTGGGLGLTEYNKLLMEHGEEIDEVDSEENSLKYMEAFIEKELIDGEFLYIGESIAYDEAKTCDYMIRSDEKMICSEIIYNKIRSEINEIIKGKWLSRLLMYINSPKIDRQSKNNLSLLNL